MSEPIIIVIISATVGAIIGPLIMLLANKMFSKKKDETDLVKNMQDIADQAVAALKQERADAASRDKWRSEEYKKVQERLRLVEQATYGPFRITLDFTTHPLSIENQRIELIVVKEEKSKPVSSSSASSS